MTSDGQPQKFRRRRRASLHGTAYRQHRPLVDREGRCPALGHPPHQPRPSGQPSAIKSRAC